MIRTRQTQLVVFVTFMMLFICGTVGITAYTIWLLRKDAIGHGFELTSMHSRSFEDVLTQNLQVTEIISPNILQNIKDGRLSSKTEQDLLAALRRTPFLRSISLLDTQGRILASTNRDNIGITLNTQSFLPAAAPDREIVRIGKPWSGRDFAEGSPTASEQVVAADESYFIPVQHTLLFNGSYHPLLLAINPDHFLNHVLQKLEASEGYVEVLRYDGIMLMSSDPKAHPGCMRNQVSSAVSLNETESANFELPESDGRRFLSSLRASRLYPFIVVTHLDRDYILRNWKGTSTTLLWFITATILTVCVTATLLYRRQTHLAEQHAALEQIQRINATVFDASTEAILITDKDAAIISVNQAFIGASGYRPDEVTGLHLCDLLTDSSAEECRKKLELPPDVQNTDTADMPERLEVQQLCKDGRLLWMEILSTPERNDKGEIVGYRRIARNITERKRAEEQLQLSANVFSHTREGILIMSPDSTIIEVNAAFSRITGYSHDEVLGQSPLILRSEQHDEAFYVAMWRELSEKGYWQGEVWSRHKNGDQLAVILTISAVNDESGKARQLVALINDITPLKTHQRELEYIAHFDSLTGLPNRVLLADRLQQAITQSKRRNLRLAVAFLDLDGFKEVNDTYGHDYGDRLLVEISRRMKHVLREVDTLARLGGDEFVVVLFDLSDTSNNIPMLQRLLEAVSQPVQIGLHTVQVSASLGVTYYPQTREIESDQLIRQADQAMYQAKMAGKNRYKIYASEGG